MANSKHVQVPVKPVPIMVAFRSDLSLDARKAAIQQLGGVPQNTAKLGGMFVTILVAPGEEEAILANYTRDTRIAAAELRKS